MSLSSLTLSVHVETHGALGDDRLSVARRTLALWLIAAAQRLLRCRLDVTYVRR